MYLTLPRHLIIELLMLTSSSAFNLSKQQPMSSISSKAIVEKGTSISAPPLIFPASLLAPFKKNRDSCANDSEATMIMVTPETSSIIAQGLNKNGTSGEEEAADSSRTVIISAAAPLTEIARISYNTGHGDFCFGKRDSWDYWDSRKAPSEEERTWCLGRLGSGGSEVADLDGFKRSGPFPFFKLPLEIRREVYHLLVGGLLRYNEETAEECITLQFDMEESSEEQDNGSDKHLVHDTVYEENCTVGNSMQHPTRSFDYHMTIDVRRHVEPPWCCSGFDWLLLRFIRHLSHVSLTMRQELGDVIWARSSIHWDITDSESWNNFWFIPKLLVERPAICRGLQSLVVGINAEDFEVRTDSYRLFPKWCDEIDGFLNLKHLHLNFWVGIDYALALVQGADTLSTLSECRRLKVSESFSVSLFVIDPDNLDARLDMANGDDFLTRKIEERDAEYTRLLEARLMPDTLRATPTNCYGGICTFPALKILLAAAVKSERGR
ncbi:hypothetical protein VTL71DRAFT_4310 [Oculimacula yallundae]|uniref:Uncharacterized protein n=1 Tax=Oculimacula yallundae TaxID=86028 RepID=A0ABR4C5E7_9HELO